MKFVVVIFSAVAVLATSKTIKDRLELEYNIGHHLDKEGLLVAHKVPDINTENITSKATHQSRISSYGNGPSAQIAYGVRAHLGNFPYQAGIIGEGLKISKYYEVYEITCGGSLITDNRVLTAAHCWWDGEIQAFRFTIVLGSVNLRTGGISIQTNKVITHYGWNPSTLHNDIALAYLPVPVRFSNNIKPIALPSHRELHSTFIGRNVLASGFGHTRHNEIYSEESLRYAKLQVISNVQCRNYYNNIWPHIMCAQGATYESTCNGDSGGPITITQNGQPILIGVVSFGSSSTCEAGIPVGFTRITSYIGWILEMLGP